MTRSLTSCQQRFTEISLQQQFYFGNILYNMYHDRYILLCNRTDIIIIYTLIDFRSFEIYTYRICRSDDRYLHALGKNDLAPIINILWKDGYSSKLFFFFTMSTLIFFDLYSLYVRYIRLRVYSITCTCVNVHLKNIIRKLMKAYHDRIYSHLHNRIL